MGRAGSPLLATSHVNRWTPGHAIATEPRSHSPALAVNRGFPLNELRDVVFIAVCEGAVQHHRKEERRMGLELLPEQKLRSSEEFCSPPYLLVLGPPSSPSRSPASTGLALLMPFHSAVPLAFSEQDYSSTVKHKPCLKAEANQGRQPHSLEEPQWSGIAVVWHRVDLCMASSSQHQ